MKDQDVPEGYLHQPKNTMPRIEEVWAFVSVDPDDGNEGVCAFRTGDAWMPLIAADTKRLEQLRQIAKDLSKFTKNKIKLVKFTKREELEEFPNENNSG